MQKHLFCRISVSHEIGLGHLFRSLAIAEKARFAGWKIHFLVEDSSLVQQYLNEAGDSLEQLGFCTEKIDASACLNYIAKFSGKNDQILIWLDSYLLGKAWEQKLARYSLAVVDDYVRQHHDSVMLVNYGVNASQSDYPNIENSRCLLGLEFLLLRQAFYQNQWQKPEYPKILVYFGGADPDHYALQVLEVLQQQPELHAEVIYLSNEALPISFWQHQLLKLNSVAKTNNMAELLSSVSVVLGACGINMWEREQVGVPYIGWQIVENQSSNFSWLRQQRDRFAMSQSPKQDQSWLATLTGILATGFQWPALLNGTSGAANLWSRLEGGA